MILQRRMLLVIILSSFITPFLSSSVNIALPQIAKEFSLNALQLNWVASVFLLFTAVFLLPAGKLADHNSKLLIFKSGLSIVAVSSLLIALCSNFWLLIFFRIVQAAGAAALFSTSVSLLVTNFPVEIRGRLLGINTAAVYGGLSLGPVLGGLITERFGWQGIFWSVALLSLVTLFFAQKMLSEKEKINNDFRFDLSGFVLYSSGLIVFMVGLSFISRPAGIGMIIAGILLLLGFVFFEKRIPDPLIEISVFRTNRVFLFSSLAALINYSATFAAGFLLSLNLQVFSGFSARQAGFLLFFQPIAQSIVAPFSGRLSDRLPPAYIASAGMVLSALGLLIFFFEAEGSYLFFAGVLLLLGIGFGLFSSPNTNAIMSSVEKSFYGQAAATVAVMRMLGQMSSMGFVLSVFALNLKGAKISAALRQPFFYSWKQIFAVFFALSLLGIFLSLKRNK